MFSLTYLISHFVLLGSLFNGITNASPLPEPESATTKLHGCSVFVQRWYDNSFDVYAYSTTSTPACSLFSGSCTQVAWVSVGAIAVGGNIPDTGPVGIPGKVGSNPLRIVNTSNPPAYKGGGTLSFTWGNQHWTSAASNCRVAPDPPPYATTTSCTFSCDA